MQTYNECILFEHVEHKTIGEAHGRADGTITNDHARASFDESKRTNDAPRRCRVVVSQYYLRVT